MPHLTYQAAHGSVSERVEALRLLEEYPSQASGDACLAGLEDRDAEVRAEAARCVGAARDERGISSLLDLAGSKDSAERAAALMALGRLAPPRALTSIEQALAQSQPAVRVAALRALVAYVRDGTFDAAKLAPLLRSEPVEVRLAVVETLASAGHVAVSTPRTAAAPDPRSAATKRLPQPESRASVQLLRVAARDQAPDVRATALRALGAARDPVLLPDLTAAMSDPEEGVRLAAIAALGDTDLPGASGPLRALVAAKAQQPSQLRAARTALAALGRIDDPSTLPPLAAALTRPELSQTAAQALLTRARRLNQPETYLQSAEALQRAIEATQPPRQATASAVIPFGSKLGARDLLTTGAPHLVAHSGNGPGAAAMPRESRNSQRAQREDGTPHFDEHSATSATTAAIPREPLSARASAPSPADETSASSAGTRRQSHGMALQTRGAKTLRVEDASASTGAEPRLSAALVEAGSDETNHIRDALDVLAVAVIELAPFCNVQPAVSSLTRTLAAGAGEELSLTQHLITLAKSSDDKARHDTLLFNALLARGSAASPRLADALVAVLTASAQAPALLAAHRDHLQRVSDARAPTSGPARALHALLQASDVESSADARRALAQLWAAQPALAAQREPLDQLVRWLDDNDPELRERSSAALALAADATTLAALSARLERGAPYPELTLRACAGAMHRAPRARIPPALRERLLQQFQAHLDKADENVAMSALLALRATSDRRSAHWIASVLRGTSPQLRAAAIQALADFDQPEARRMLRDMLRGDNVQHASNAALALAELGSDRDVEALLRAAQRGSWPLPPAAAYAAARITARGSTRKHSLERVLCRFTALRDSYVLSNIVSALASLGADACDDHIQPQNLLDPALPSALRVAAALWLQSTRPHSAEASVDRKDLLARCAGDHDPVVAAACAPRDVQAEQAGQTLVKVLEPDARGALRNRVVALRQPDATVFVGPSDSSGFVLLPRAAAGELWVEDPAYQEPLAFPDRLAKPSTP